MKRKRSTNAWISQWSRRMRQMGWAGRRWSLVILSVCLGLLCSPIALSLAPPIPERAPEAATLAEQGRTLYESGQFGPAITVWQQLADTLQAQGDRLGQAMALSNLSLAYQQLGQWPQAARAIEQSLQLLQTEATQPQAQPVLAQALNTQGSLQLAQGQADQALATWQQAEATYAQVNDAIGVTRSQINQAQAMQTLGLYRRALKTLQQLDNSLQTAPDSPLKLAQVQALGNVLRLVGDLEDSRSVLERGLAIAQRLQPPPDTGEIFLSLGNTVRAQQALESAIGYYQQAAQSTVPLTRLRALLNQFSLLEEMQQPAAALKLLPTIQTQLDALPASSAAIEARINLAQSLTRLTGEAAPHDLNAQTAKLLAKAVTDAKALGNAKLESFALGELGQVYEQNQQFAAAQTLTQQALSLSQELNAADISYRWQWQLGRLQLAQGDRTGAITAYTEAVRLLKSLRSDLVAINPEVQFSFRESVEPIYRQLVGLLLQSAQPSQENLAQARSLIESLQLAELDNFFQEACLQARAVQIDQVDPEAAVIYPIILNDRLEVILSLPDRSLHHYTTRLSRQEIEQILFQLKQSFGRLASPQERLRRSQQVYDWLVRPVLPQLNQIQTLVFVLDGALRDIPMAALHDGQHYLIEQYRLALSPGLQLLPSHLLDKQRLQVLQGGLSAARPGFSALPAVKMELEQIAAEVRGKVLLDQDLTSANLKTYLRNAGFNVIHLATHGQFSSNAKDTFILTWDGRINVKQLDTLFRDRAQAESMPLELLVLSACQTASGDDRAILGLAGIAVRSGANSTLATLWSVKDQATAAFMVQFYRELLQPGVTRAEAVRRAQLELLKNPRFAHPVFWAPFVLVGSWL